MENDYRSDGAFCPPGVDWGTFGRFKVECLQKYGCSRHYPWMNRAYRWLFGRLPKSLCHELKSPTTDETLSPHPKWIPFPVAGNSRHGLDAGAVLFCAVDSSGGTSEGTESSTLPSAAEAHAAARYIFDLFRQLDPEVGYPNIDISLGFQRAPLSGDSLSLPVMIASFGWLLKVHLPDDLIATGGFNNDRKRLEPVGKETLDEKITAAARLGYHTFVIVKGQTAKFEGKTLPPQELFEKLKDGGPLPKDTVMEFVEADTDPLNAFIDLVKRFVANPDTSDAQGLARLLAAYGKNRLEKVDFERIGFLENNPSELVRHVYCDLASRRALHRGETRLSEKYREAAPKIEPHQFPFGWLGSYLKFEETASRSVLQIDLGMWDDSDPTHEKADRILSRLMGNIADSAADIEDVRCALALANTRALRRLFRARLDRSPEPVQSAWGDVIRFERYWEEIFKYTKARGLDDETLSRQRNQVISYAECYRYLTGSLPSEFEIVLPRAELIDLRDSFDSYDLCGWLTYRFLIGQTPNDEEVNRYFQMAEKCAQSQEDRGNSYPYYLPFEKLLLRDLGTEDQRGEARERLRQALEHHASEGGGILSLLMMRCAAIAKFADFPPERFLDQLKEDSPLRALGEELISRPEEIIGRTPY